MIVIGTAAALRIPVKSLVGSGHSGDEKDSEDHGEIGRRQQQVGGETIENRKEADRTMANAKAEKQKILNKNRTNSIPSHPMQNRHRKLSATAPPLIPPTYTGSKGTKVLVIQENPTGVLAACITVQHVIILCCNQQLDWSPVGICERPSFGTSLQVTQVAWNQDSSSLVLCNSLGIAEFYDIANHPSDSKGTMQAIRLSLPRWVVGTETETRSGKFLGVTYRCSINSTVDGDQVSLHSVVANRMWLQMGTSRGSIIRVLWTGEVVLDREIDVFPYEEGTILDNGGVPAPARDTIVQVAVGWQQRVGFVSKSGACGIINRKNMEEGNEPSICYVCSRKTLSIDLHKVRPLLLVGLEGGDVEVHAVGNTSCTILKTIAFPEHEVPYHLTENKKDRGALFAGVSQLRWCPDGSNIFGAGYNDIGYIVWSTSGCRAATIAISTQDKDKEKEKEEERYVPAFAWGSLGFSLITNTLRPNENGPLIKGSVKLNYLELVKSCSLSGQLVSGSTSMCMYGWNYIMTLQNQEWDVKTIAWQRTDLPQLYINENWPIRLVAASLSGDYIAVCGAKGAAIYSKISKRWNLFEDINQEKNITPKMLFWWGDEILCMVVRDTRTRKWELVCFPRDRLEMSAVLGRTTLPGRPNAVDTMFSGNVAILQIANSLCMFQIRPKYEPEDLLDQMNPEDVASVSDGDEGDNFSIASDELVESTAPLKTGSEQDGNEVKKLGERKNSLFVIRRASSASVGGALGQNYKDGMQLDLVETIQLDLGVNEDHVPTLVSVMPCGGTRRAGFAIKFPKCALLTSKGHLYMVDMDEGAKTTIATGVHQLFPQSWSKIDECDDIVLQSYIEELSILQKQRERERRARRLSASSTGSSDSFLDGSGSVVSTSSTSSTAAQGVPGGIKLPSVLLFTVWIMDDHGLRLWLPALDIDGESLGTRCHDAHLDVIPIGILESHGLVVGVSQRARFITKRKEPCYEISIRVTPSTHGLLSWLIAANRVDLASQTLVQASTHLPLFRETVDLFLFNIVETDYKNKNKDGYTNLLPWAIKLLRKGKVATIIDPRTYDSIVVTVARKMESSRWPLFFKSASNPEQLFNDAIYAGELRTAAGSMIIADYFSPEKSSKRIAALAHAAHLKKDDQLLKEINHFQKTKLG